MNKLIISINLVLICAVGYLATEVWTLKQDNKNMRAEITTGRLIVTDEANQMRIVLNALDGETTLTMLDGNGVPRRQVAIDGSDNLNDFIFDIEGSPRVGYFSQQTGEFLNYQDQVEAYKPAS
ncbi:hypothetical protein [Paraferrimonas sedimenticola]|uniref:Uncharacterized protein n=1 Tax=Paraferrimonas sedimenticola TaxID=375674 RepID=A0AA37VV76_9GAMM|nr:hypothetical protein [Paraferrimonas sedimenticola]GLP96069.1 hypothetical protein GCM10007895_13750 [Paraferrimonas sedimenticola]